MFVTIATYCFNNHDSFVIVATPTLTRKEEKKKKLVRRRERKVPLESQEKIKHAKQIWERVRRWVWLMGVAECNVYCPLDMTWRKWKEIY